MSKVVIIGCGFVGATIAYTMVLKNLMDTTVIIDINEELAMGEASDIAHGLAMLGVSQIRSGKYEDCRDADLIIITAGVNRKVGQTRDDLLEINEGIISSVLDNIALYYNGCFVLIVSNPVDQLTSYAYKKGFIKKNKIGGTGCLLDTSRWISELSKYLHVDINRIHAYAVGKHGSEQDLLWDYTQIDGLDIKRFCDKNNIIWNDGIKNQIHQKVTGMGAEIIRKKGRTQFGIAAAVACFVSCLVKTEYTIMSVGNVLNMNQCKSNIVKVGNYEITDVCEGIL